MPQYRKVQTSELGELDFYGNAGVMAQFEDETDSSLYDLASGKKVSFSKMYSLVFWAHFVACKRLKKDIKASREDLSLYLSGKEITNLFMNLVKDIIEDMGLNESNDSEKKMTVQE